MWEDFYLGNQAKWEICNTDMHAANEISSKLGLPQFMSKLLLNRGLNDAEQIKAFLKPTIGNLNDPMLLPDMDEAVQRILEARERKEKVIVYGDYDVDGITATSILFDFLRSIGMDVSFYIPNRTDEGYGISENAAEYLVAHPFDLMITVDCGITEKDRIAQIQKKLSIQKRKMSFIITDHHRPGEEKVPDADAIINPHFKYSQYPFRHLCGAGISFKLVQALCNSLNLGERFLDYVDLAALGTVADIVNIMGENRIIVWAGLKKIKRCPNLGIQALMKISGLKKDQVDSCKLAFVLAPRVNAAGRIGDAKRGVRLFTTKDVRQAESFAAELQKDNAMRQRIQEEIYKKALKNIESDSRYDDEKVIVVFGEDWHHGVIGIVASKLVDRYGKPCFVLSVSGDTATGSARSIEGFNIFSAMEHCNDYFTKYGGHKQAGGLTMHCSKILDFRTEINRYASKNLEDDLLIPKITVDIEANTEEINMNTVEAVMAMEPFGEGNPVPVFRLNGIPVLMKKRMGMSGEHLKLILGTQIRPVHAVAFHIGVLEPYIPQQGEVDLLFTVNINEYMGKRNLQLIVKAIRLPGPLLQRNRVLLKAAEKVESLDYDEEWIYNGINHPMVSFDDISLSREELGVLYRYLLKTGSRTFNRAELFLLAEEITRKGMKMNYFKLMSGLFVLDELDIICFSYEENGRYTLHIPETNEKTSLDNSMLFSFLQTLKQVIEE